MVINARTTVMFFANRADSAIVRMIANTICWTMQVTFFGWPMGSNAQRNKRQREMRRV